MVSFFAPAAAVDAHNAIMPDPGATDPADVQAHACARSALSRQLKQIHREWAALLQAYPKNHAFTEAYQAQHEDVQLRFWSFLNFPLSLGIFQVP
jgi:hypothetical protein